MNKTRAILFTSIGEIALKEVEIPEPEAGEVLVESIYTCISPGTELRCLSGQQPEGTQFPYIPGYANVGRIRRCGPGVERVEGALVLSRGTVRASVSLCWGGHAGLAVVRDEQCLELPEGLDPSEAASAVLAAIAYHGVRLGNPRPDETVACVGLGPIGMFSAVLHAATGARVIGFDLFEERVAHARSLGLEAHQPEGRLADFTKAFLPEGADIVVDATGAARVLADSVALLRTPPWETVLRDVPRLVVQGSYGEPMTLSYQQAFMKEAAVLFPRNHTLFDDRAVLDLMVRGKLPASKIVGEVREPKDASEVYKTLKENPREMLTANFRWS